MVKKLKSENVAERYECEECGHVYWTIEKAVDCEKSHQTAASYWRKQQDKGIEWAQGHQEEQTHKIHIPKTSPTKLWYLAPLLFGLVGGILGYALTKDEDEDMATTLLIFGCVWTIALAVIGWIIFFL